VTIPSDWVLDVASKVAATMATAALLGLIGWAWRVGRQMSVALVWLADNVQTSADHVRRVAHAGGLDHHKLDAMTDCLEATRYSRLELIPPDRHRRRGEGLRLCEGVDAVRAIRRRVRAGSPEGL
jgi:hypothetical protein